MTTTEEGWIGNTVTYDIELARLRNLESLLDGHSRRLLDDVAGVEPGWRCLELGAGAGSITRWLAERVGPNGTVVAVDIEPRFLVDLPDNVEVRALDAATADFGTGEYDLVHHRAVLAYVPQRDEVVSRLASALRPGGWLLGEEPAFSLGGRIVSGDPDGAIACWYATLCSVLQAAGTELDFGLRLPGVLQELALVDIGNRGLVDVATGGSDWAINAELLVRGLHEKLCALGVTTPEESDATIAALQDPANAFVSPAGMSAWGRRP